MRLQVSIRRHALPVINIIFTTATGPSSKTLAPQSTVTDLLYDVNDLVPLESADGEWGLEDYVVEVQATADQETYYECLHYQTIESVLREDDEVVIRCLGTEDLRSRRLGGRHQISADGRHLIDGVAFGRQWLRKGGRPAINIPPRKRMRLEIEGDNEDLDGESTTLLEQLKELGYSNGELDEDENDDDFVDDANGEEAEDGSDEGGDAQPLRIKATADFGSADGNEDEESQDDSDNDGEEVMAGTCLELSDELKALLVEAEQLSENDTYHRLPSEAAQSPRKRKRKRDDAEEEDQEVEDASEFEGFSTPSKQLFAINSPPSSVSCVSMLENTTASSDPDSDSDSDSDSDDAAGPEDTSSSGSSASGHSSSSETSDSDSDDQTSSSDSSSDSSSEGSTKLEEKNPSFSSPAKQASSKAHSASNSSNSSSSTTSPYKRPQAAPGEGLSKTHNNNQRTRRRQRLARLKRDGILHPDAKFADMAAFDEHTQAQLAPESAIQVDMQKDFESKKAALLQHLRIENETADDTMFETPKIFENDASVAGVPTQEQAMNTENINVDKQSAEDRFGLNMSTRASVNENEINKENMLAGDDKEVEEIVPSQEIGAKAQESFIGKATPKSTEKRAKLDLASSRRMLFNSLGLRNPKTPEAEQALRERLAKDIKRTPQRKSEERVNQEMQVEDTSENDMDSWKDRIVLSAVECEYDGISLSTPPFPFKQGWDSNANMRRGANKKNGRKQSKYYDGGDEYAQEYAPDVSTLQTPRQDLSQEQHDRPDSRTLSFEEQEADRIPRPSDFRNLPNLGTADLVPGAVIAFQELHIHNFQPVVSEYRVARVIAVQKEDSADVIEVMLSRKDWPVVREGSDPFAIEDEDKQPEDGLRTKRFADLIEPKLIETSSKQVNAPTVEIAEKEHPLGEPQVQGSILPESIEAAQKARPATQPKPRVLKMTHVEVSTPRRNEITAIIKEAGFDSAIDKDLLQPEDELEPEPQSSPAFHTRSHRGQQSSLSPAPATIASTTNLAGPCFDSKGLNGWDSSPLQQVGAESSVIGPSEASEQPAPTKPRPETQSSIPYPALSQLEIDASGVTVTNDSSFQDAQRVSPPPDFDTSALRPDLDTSKLHPEYPYDDYGIDETQASLASEVPQTQSPHPSSQATTTAKSAKTSFLGHGLDGQDSSYEESDFASDNSSLPGMRELTSSQNNKIKHASRRARVSPPVARASNAVISPPAVKGKRLRLRNGIKHSVSPEQSKSDDNVEIRPVKMSQSQVPRMSQIPAGSQIVDLTFSSSPEKPQSDAEYQVPRTRGAKAKKHPRERVKGQSSGSISFDDGEEASVGIGKRRFLTTKKWSSRSHV